MTLTHDVKAELVRVDGMTPQARSAELTTILRLAGGMHSIAGRPAVEAEVDARALARRVSRDLVELYGVRPEIVQVQQASGGEGARYAVRVLAEGETLGRRLGLIDQRRRLVRGLPNRLTTGALDQLAAIWRGAFLATGSLTEPGRSAALDIVAPTPEAAMALVGAAGRLGISAKAREVRGQQRVVVRDSEAIGDLLEKIGAPKTAAAWAELRQRREVRAGVNRLVNFDDANLRRSAQAAVAACARVERAMELLADEKIPDNLRTAGNLRLQYREASLDELGQHADPPISKDTVAGRIRRLLAMADKRAAALGVPSTKDAVPEGFDEE